MVEQQQTLFHNIDFFMTYEKKGVNHDNNT